MLASLSARLQVLALHVTRRLSKPAQGAGITGVNLLARQGRASLLRGQHRRLLGGGAAFGAASMLTDGGAAVAASLHTVSPQQLLAAFKEMGLLGWLGVDLAINWAGWAVAAAFKTEKFYDLLGSASFLTLTAGTLLTGGAMAPRKLLVSAMVGGWALRLGSYLVARVHKTGKDARFDEVKHQPGKFWVYWTMQAVWVFVTSLPVLLINTSRAAAPLTPWDAIGISVFATGFLIECVADYQKSAFKARPDSKGRFIDEGLWSYARHPNYFGEMMLWWGVFLTCAPGFTSPWQLASVASPVVVFLLIRFVSGVPLLEDMAQQRWGTEPEFQAYRARTNLLLPLPREKDTHTS